MTIANSRGTIYFKKWDPSKGLTERAQSFTNFAQLLDLCHFLEPGESVDRIEIYGLDDHETLRQLSLAFQSERALSAEETNA